MRAIQILFVVLILILPGVLLAQTPVHVDGTGTYTPVKSTTATIFTADQTLGNAGGDTDSYKVLFITDSEGTDYTGGVNVPLDSSGYGPCLTFSTPDQSDGSIAEVMFLYLEEGSGALYFTPDGGIDIGEDGTFRPNNYFGAGDMTVAGNVLGNTAAYDFIPIEWCHDGAVPPDAAAEVASGTGKVQVRNFGGAAGNIVQDVVCPWEVPDNIVAASGIKFRVSSVVTDAVAPDASDINFKLSGYSVGDNDSIGDAFGAEVAIGKTNYTAAQYDRVQTAYSGVVTVDDLAAGELAFLHFERDTDNLDDYLKPLGVTGIKIQYQELSAGF